MHDEAIARNHIDSARLMADIEALARIGVSPAGGLERRTFSAPWLEACDWLRTRMHEAGLAVRVDAAGSVIGRLGPATGPALLIGSHIDTVPSGGPLDGAYGVLAGLEVARVLAATAPGIALEVVAFADEEGAWYDLFGSRAMTGTIDAAELERVVAADGTTMVAAMHRCGLDHTRIGEAARPASDLLGYLELHIEQGPVLEDCGVPIGVVDGIVGIMHTDFEFSGRADHAGTTPMDIRRDALRATADFVTRAYGLLATHAATTTRMTYGHITVTPNAANVVPARVLLREELRDLDAGRMHALAAHTRRLAAEVAAAHELRVNATEMDVSAPALMAPAMVARIESACTGRGLAFRRLPSGAGHDAQIMAGACPAGMIFVPSRGGASHRPDEWTDPAALARGAEVLLDAARALLQAH